MPSCESVEERGPDLVGRTLRWRILSLTKHNWVLEDGTAAAVSLVKPKRLRERFMATYGCTHLAIEYDSKTDSSSFINEGTGTRVGTLSILLGVLEKASFICDDGRVFPLLFEPGFGYTLRDQQGVLIALEVFDNRSTPVTSSVTYYDLEDVINPWLTAVILQYYAIHHAYGWP